MADIDAVPTGDDATQQHHSNEERDTESVEEHQHRREEKEAAAKKMIDAYNMQCKLGMVLVNLQLAEHHHVFPQGLPEHIQAQGVKFIARDRGKTHNGNVSMYQQQFVTDDVSVASTGESFWSKLLYKGFNLVSTRDSRLLSYKPTVATLQKTTEKNKNPKPVDKLQDITAPVAAAVGSAALIADETTLASHHCDTNSTLTVAAVDTPEANPVPLNDIDAASSLSSPPNQAAATASGAETLQEEESTTLHSSTGVKNIYNKREEAPLTAEALDALYSFMKNLDELPAVLLNNGEAGVPLVSQLHSQASSSRGDVLEAERKVHDKLTSISRNRARFLVPQAGKDGRSTLCAQQIEQLTACYRHFNMKTFQSLSASLDQHEGSDNEKRKPRIVQENDSDFIKRTVLNCRQYVKALETCAFNS